MEERAVRLVITGLVQGVGYRAFVEAEARRHGLRGWVRNRRDRSVEAVLAGAPEAIGEAIIACRRGPFGSQVEHLDVTEAGLEEAGEGFSVRPTA